jgi:hypothetical protein
MFRGGVLAITNGTQFGKIDNGISATLAPQLYEPFRATSRARLEHGGSSVKVY